MRRQQRLAGDEGNLQWRNTQPGEPVLGRQRQLDAAGAAADDGEPQPPHLSGAGQQGFPALGKTGDRLDRDRVLDGAGDFVRTRGRADIERQEVVADRRVSAAQQAAFAAVKADRLVADQPRAGEAGQPAEIDVAFVEGVMSGDPTRQHARIRGLDIPGD